MDAADENRLIESMMFYAGSLAADWRKLSELAERGADGTVTALAHAALALIQAGRERYDANARALQGKQAEPPDVGA